MLFIEDTIVALATAPAASAVGIIRLSGRESFSILNRIFKGSRAEFSFQPNRLYFGKVVDPVSKQVLDEGLVVYFRAPSSFTGEDCVELQMHGAPVNLSRIIALCQSCGARLAEPGEFSKRAFLNGKMDLSQAEAISDLINSQSLKQAQNAMSQLSGYLHDIINKMRLQIIESLALLEVGFDFSEEDLEAVESSKILTMLDDIYRDIGSLIGTFAMGQFVAKGLKVALIGKPNVGKSSLMNRLLLTDKSIIHQSAGTTRDVIEGDFHLSGIPVKLYDTAGIRDTTDEIEQFGVIKSQEVLGKSDLILFLLDGSRPLDLQDEFIWQSIKLKPHILVRTKSDLQSVWREALFDALSEPLIDVSVKSDIGVNGLFAAIESIFHKSVRNYDTNYVLNNVRHYNLLQEAHTKIGTIVNSLRSSTLADECLVEELRCVAELLGGITGVVSSETVLDEIFSRFCIGK